MAGEWLNGLDFQWLRNDGRGSNTFLQAFQIGAQIKQNAINSEFRKEQAQAHWRAMELRAAIESSKLKAQENIASGHAELGQVLSEIAQNKSWTDPAAKARFWGTASKYPQLMASPTFKELTQQFELADQAAWRAQLEDTKMGGRKDIENLKFEHRESLMDDKYDRLAELQEDSQDARTIRDEIIHGYNLERDAKRPNTSGQKKYDMPYSIELKYRAKLNAINKDLDMKPEDRQKQIEAVYREMKSQFSAPAQPSATQAPAVPAKRIRVKAPDGTIGHIPEAQLDEAKRSGYTIAE